MKLRTKTASGPHCSISWWLLLLALLPGLGRATTIYFNDFQGSPDMSGWSHSTRTTDNNGETVLGVFPTKSASFGTTQWTNTGPVTFTLPSLNSGHYTVSFDLFTLSSWDGHGGCCQPDYFKFWINDVPFIDATFSNNLGSNQKQGYSKSTPLAGTSQNNDPTTDNSGKNILAITPFAGSNKDLVPNFRYSLLFDFDHAGGDLALKFLGQTTPAANDLCTTQWCGLNYYDEPWAIDNVRIQSSTSAIIPEPPIWTLMLPGLLLAGRRIFLWR
ncbi:MAG: hypothetical protein D6720_10965 [Gammaproteobacteria bacterium]|nr:MAG: hypothetical protein D6720_10965 [Gammaproteobacteria bacterium]